MSDDPIGDAAVEAYKRSGTAQRPVLMTLDGELSPEREAAVRAQAHQPHKTSAELIEEMRRTSP